MGPLTSVPVHTSWDLSFHAFNEVSVLYSGLQIRNTFGFIEYMSVSKVPDAITQVCCVFKVPDVTTQVCCLQNRCFSYLATVMTTARRTTAVVVLLSHSSLTWECLSLLLGTSVARVAPCTFTFPMLTQVYLLCGCARPGHTNWGWQRRIRAHWPAPTATLSIAPGWPDNTYNT